MKFFAFSIALEVFEAMVVSCVVAWSCQRGRLRSFTSPDRFGSDNIGRPRRRAIKLEYTNLNSYNWQRRLARRMVGDALADPSAPHTMPRVSSRRFRGVPVR